MQYSKYLRTQFHNKLLLPVILVFQSCFQVFPTFLHFSFFYTCLLLYLFSLVFYYISIVFLLDCVLWNSCQLLNIFQDYTILDLILFYTPSGRFETCTPHSALAFMATTAGFCPKQHIFFNPWWYFHKQPQYWFDHNLILFLQLRFFRPFSQFMEAQRPKDELVLRPLLYELTSVRPKNVLFIKKTNW